MKPPEGKHRTHPLDVTRNRLIKHYEDYWQELTGRERDVMVRCILLLEALVGDPDDLPANRGA